MTDGAELPVGAADASAEVAVVRGERRWRAWLPVPATALVLAVVPLALGGSRFFLGLAVLGLAFAGYGIGFNIIFGNTNQLFLCQGALAAVGAYASTILVAEWGWPWPVAVAVSVGVASALGALFSLVSVRRRLDVIFVGIVTLTFSRMVSNLLLGQRAVTGGETGLVVLDGADALADRGLAAYFVFLAVVVAFLAVHRWIQRSHVGWAFRAVRDDELAAELAGVDVTRYKVLAGAVGSAMIGLVGALYAQYEGFVSPATFALGNVDIPVLVMVSFGGVGTLLGPVVGAAVFTIIDELLRPFSQLRVTAYGVVLILLFLGFRRGVVPSVGGLFSRHASRRTAE